MKKITVLLLSFTIVAATAFAQTNRMSGGISLGANYSKVSAGDNNSGNNFDWKWKWGPVGGLWFDFPIASSLSIAPSVLYSAMGTKYNVTNTLTNTTTKWTQKLNYISVPVLLKIKAGNSIGILLGPEVDFLAGAKVKDQNDNKTDNKSDFKSTDFALSGGLQIAPSSPVSFTLRYIHGLADVRDASSNATTFSGAFHNRGIQGTLNFRLFGGPKKTVAITTPTPPVVEEKKEVTTVTEPPKPDLCAIDSDKDGVMDCNDKCPSVAGVARYNGCPIPDTDNDGVNDEEDNCPSLPGPASNHGCPLVDQSTQSKIDMMTKNITWTQSKGYTLTTTSNKSLDQIASMLTADPNLKVAVNAYTDNKVDDSKTLSQNRADAIKTYLVSKGVKESQITATGYGADQPVADNGTSAGRAKNNRVEIKLSY